MHHPEVGELELHREKLIVAGTQDQVLVIYHAGPATPSAQALACSPPSRPAPASLPLTARPSPARCSSAPRPREGATALCPGRRWHTVSRRCPDT
jgi:hypothetical protein